MLGLLLDGHLFYDASIFDPVPGLIGCAAPCQSLINISLLALECDLGRAIDKAKEVISVKGIILFEASFTHMDNILKTLPD